MKLSLFFRLFFAVGGCTAGAIVISLIVQNHSLSRDLKEAARQRIEGASRAAETLVENHISSVADQYEVVARTPQLRGSVESKDGPTLTYYAQTLLTKEHAAQLAFIDDTGTIVASAGAAVFDPLSITENTLLEIDGTPYVAVTTPLVTAERSLGRLVTIELITRELVQSWSNLIGATVIFTLPHHDGPGLTIKIDRFDPVPIFVTTTLVREAAAKRHARLNLLGAGLLALGAALFASWFLSRGFTKPILEIKRAAEEIGAGNLSVRLNIERSDEIGDVGHSVNRMAEKIEQSAHVIQHANDSLLDSNALIAKARDRAERSSRAKSEFVANKAPELRDSIEETLSTLEALLGSTLDEDQARIAHSARESVAKLDWIVSGIVDLSKIETGTLTLDTVDLCPSEIVEDLVSSYSPKARGREVRIFASVANGAPATVRGDPKRMTQMISHLIRNALEHTSSGEIVVEVSAGQRFKTEVELRFSVLDTGSGIDPETLVELQKSLADDNSFTAQEVRGTGVGLAVCRRLSQLMGGGIEVESTEGVGSTFTATVRVAVTDWHYSKFIYQLRAVDVEAVRVLVVDPSETGRETLAEQIRAWGVTAEVEGELHSVLDRVRDAASAGEPIRIVFLHVSAWDETIERLSTAFADSPTLRATRLVAVTALESAPPETIAARISDPPQRAEVLAEIIDARGGPRLDERTSFRFAARPDEVI